MCCHNSDNQEYCHYGQWGSAWFIYIHVSKVWSKAWKMLRSLHLGQCSCSFQNDCTALQDRVYELASYYQQIYIKYFPLWGLQPHICLQKSRGINFGVWLCWCHVQCWWCRCVTNWGKISVVVASPSHLDPEISEGENVQHLKNCPCSQLLLARNQGFYHQARLRPESCEGVGRVGAMLRLTYPCPFLQNLWTSIAPGWSHLRLHLDHKGKGRCASGIEHTSLLPHALSDPSDQWAPRPYPMAWPMQSCGSQTLWSWTCLRLSLCSVETHPWMIEEYVNNTAGYDWQHNTSFGAFHLGEK